MGNQLLHVYMAADQTNLVYPQKLHSLPFVVTSILLQFCLSQPAIFFFNSEEDVFPQIHEDGFQYHGTT